MNNLIFLSSILIVFLMLVEKLYFLYLESSFLNTLIGKIEYISLVIITIVICFTWWKNISLNKDKETKKNIPSKIYFPEFSHLHLKTGLLFSLIVAVIGLSLYVNLSKQSLDGDGVSLYDARAKFLQAGYKFSNMNDLSIFDNQNQYYYLLYPPYTSIAHYFWYQGRLPFPVSVVYSFYFILLASGLFLLVRNSLGIGWSLFLVLAVIFHNEIFLNATNEHTYLPFTLYLVYGIFLIARFFKDRLIWEFLCGALLIAIAQWIRFSEVVWVGVIIAYFLTIIVDFIKMKTIHHYKIYVLLGIIFSIVSVLEYQSWTYFVKNVADTPNQNSFNYLYAPLNILKDNYLQHFVNLIQFLFFAWGPNLFIFIISLFSQARVNIKQTFNLNILFIKAVIFLVIVMYMMGLYGASFGGDWWEDLNVSLLGSSSFLIPLSYYLIFINTKEFFQKYNWKNFLKISVKEFFPI